MPLAVIQSQISVPSRSIASPLNPPPGKTIIDTPAFLPLAGKIVIVGDVTSRTNVHGLPATSLFAVTARSGGGGLSSISGAPFGQIGIWTLPAGASKAR